ncbi:MAG: bifunctional phosphoribosylaminoimidazolecarboxamide formyltransferase/IMP cyclohydrolase [Planctomycetota bacterium]|nr:bifunctional phosphoribosylaminoimidazolecarboxamide formyltransferase/IMP cyclohydrolase [Planctomycetota bacterium]
MAEKRLALISVSDKRGVVEFARGLAGMGFEILSTGGTARTLREAGIAVKDVSEYTGFPEMLDGRVKTLHPKVHGGLLFRRDLESHRTQAAEHGILPIDLVCVNLYPFEETVAKPGVTPPEAIEQIDIGGPGMIRSAAKNFESVTVVVDPDDYEDVLAEMQAGGGKTTRATRMRLAAKVFATTSAYDAAICAYIEGLGEGEAPGSFRLHGALKQPLRYGENPHQKAAFYAEPGAPSGTMGASRLLSGKELSFNNILDLDAALNLVREFTEPCACIIKHNNPCGAAIGRDIREAFEKAYAGDPLSAFGGVLGVNVEFDAKLARDVASGDRFLECIVAPAFAPEAVEIIVNGPKWGKNARLVEAGPLEHIGPPAFGKDVKKVSGGFLVQDPDRFPEAGKEWAELKTVTRREPTGAEWRDLKFAWLVAKHVKSNAIVLARDCAVVGVGAGQMSRVDSVHMACRKAGERAKGASMGSDAFFPFPDGVEMAAAAGVSAAIQPGGSLRDKDVIAAADRLGMAMVFTGIRHFRH